MAVLITTQAVHLITATKARVLATAVIMIVAQRIAMGIVQVRLIAIHAMEHTIQDRAAVRVVHAQGLLLARE